MASNVEETQLACSVCVWGGGLEYSLGPHAYPPPLLTLGHDLLHLHIRVKRSDVEELRRRLVTLVDGLGDLCAMSRVGKRGDTAHNICLSTHRVSESAAAFQDDEGDLVAHGEEDL